MIARERRLARRIATHSWWLAKFWYKLQGIRIEGRPNDAVWYFESGANMHDGALQERR
jgi:hypothetical protein